MPTIRIDYDNKKLKDEDVLAVSNAIQKIVADITGIEDTFVYADSPHIQVKSAPIEIFVQASAGLLKDKDVMMTDIKNRLADWKKESGFAFPINLTLMPMDWKFEIGI